MKFASLAVISFAVACQSGVVAGPDDPSLLDDDDGLGGDGGTGEGGAGQGNSSAGQAGARATGGRAGAAAAGGAPGGRDAGAGYGGVAGQVMGGAGGKAGQQGPGADAGAGGMAGAGTTPVFVAQAFGALELVTCDDGRTWKKTNQFDMNNDDHSEFSSQGLAFGDGVFVGVFGWGAATSAYRSDDASTWVRSFRDDRFLGFGDVAFGNGVFMAGARMISRDRGRTWTSVPDGRNARRTFFLDRGPGRFLYQDGVPIRWTEDLGRTWHDVNGPDSCQDAWHFGGNIVKNGGTTVIVNGEGSVCISTDDVSSMQFVTTLDTQGIGSLIWDGGQWVAASRSGNISGRTFRSKDGRSWTSELQRPADTRIHWIARSPVTGTWVGADSETGQLYRSDDGLTWKSTAKFDGARFSELVFGRVTMPPACS